MVVAVHLLMSQQKQQSPSAIEPKLRLTVTYMDKRWVATLYVQDEEFDRMACENKCDIGWICRELLRWFSKLGGVSEWAESARRRQTPFPQGRVWGGKQLR